MSAQPDVAGAILALDQAMIALAVAKSTLLGETSRPVPLASLRDRERYDDAASFPHQPHLPQHVGGNPECTLCASADHYALHAIEKTGEAR